MEGIILVDADDDSITVTWPPIGKPTPCNPTRYSLQYRPSTSATDNGHDSGGSLLYTSLTTDITTTSARKRNLTGAGHGFWFRVSAATKSKTRVDKSSMDYVGHACRAPFKVLTMMEESRRMQAPTAKIDASTASPTPNSYVAHVSWTPYQTGGDEDALFAGFKLQMRENDSSSGWSTVAKCLSGIEVRKKNLTSKHGYMFRVRPVLRGETGGRESNLDMSVCEGGNVIPFSCASDVVGARKSSSGTCSSSRSELLKLFKNLPNDSLLARGGAKHVKVSDAFAKADLVLLYVSSQSCSTCEKFTPELARFYSQNKKIYKADPKRAKSIEIVLVSSDKDEKSFRKHYDSMPWLAVPFESDTRERLLSWMKATGGPKLMTLDGRTGKILESNGVVRALDCARFAKMVK